jgi:hypothetical protein
MNFPANHWTKVGHFYTPIAMFDGKVLKYQGLATEGNKTWFVEQNPGTIILDKNMGDRINANDHSLFAN